MELIYASRRKELKKAATADIQQYLEQFTKNKEDLSKKGDYEKKLLTAIFAGKYLVSQIRQTNPELSKKYAKLAKEYESERVHISNRSRW